MKTLWAFALACLSGAVAADAVPPPRYFFAEPVLDLAALSPNGRHVAAAGHDGRDRLVLVFDDRGQRRVIARLGRQRVHAIHWATGERLLVVHGGAGEAPGILALNRDGSMQRALVAPIGDGRRRDGAAVVSLLPRQPNRVLVALDLGAPFQPDLLALDIFTGAAELRERNPGDVLQWLPDGNGNVGAALAWSTRDDRVRYRLLHRQRDERAWTSVYEFHPGESELVPLGHDAEGLLVQLRDGDGPARLHRFDGDRGAFGPVLLRIEGHDAERLRLSGPEGRIAMVEYHAERPARRILEPRWTAWHERLQGHFGDSELTLIGLSGDESMALLLVASDRDPGSFWRYRIEADQPQRLGARMPWFRSAGAARREPIRIRARDGLSLQGYLSRPQTGGRAGPLLLFPHGGPWSRDRWGFDPVVQYFVSRGFSVLQVNYRGSRGFGPTFLGKGRRAWGGAMQQDLYDALDWAIDEGIADPARVMIFGASYGGYAALLAAQQAPTRWRVAAAFAPVTDLPLQIHDWRRLGHRRAEAEWRDMVGDPDQLVAVSPMHLAPPEVPLFLAHGRRDARVAIEHSRRYAERAGVPESQQLWLARADHELLHADTAIPFFEALDAFLAAHFGATDG